VYENRSDHHENTNLDHCLLSPSQWATVSALSFSIDLTNPEWRVQLLAASPRRASSRCRRTPSVFWALRRYEQIIDA